MQKTRRLYLVCSVLLAIAPCAHGADAITHQIALPGGMTWCDDTMINGLFTQINAYRSQNGLAPLAMSSLGMMDAEIRATQFASYMATTSPTSPGFDPHQGYDTTAASLGYNIVGENLAYISTDPAYIVGSIWQDPLHVAAMLNTSANVAGVSCVYYNATAYWTYEPGSCSGTSCSSSPTPTPTPTPSPTPSPSGTPTLDSEEWSFLTLINNYRAQNGLGPLQVSVELQNSSQWMSTDMAAKNYFSHTDSLGRSTPARLAAFGYTYSPWGENLAAGYSDAQDTFNQWQTACDPDASGNCTYAHRQNMLGAGFVAIGIARASNPNSTYGWYWTTDFGGYLDQAIAPPSGTTQPPSIGSFKASPASIVAGQSAVLSWTVSGATTVSIDNGVGAVSGTSISVAPLQTTTYTMTATNAGGSTTAAVTIAVSAARDTQPPTAPTLISALAKSATEIDLSWTASTGNVAVTGYQVLRNGALLGTTSGTVLSYADKTVTSAITYTYSVRAYDASANYSALSNSIAVTTPGGTTTTLPSIRINAGGPSYTDASGKVWTADSDFSGGANWTVSNPISNTSTPGLYQTCRWGGFTYTFNVPNGNYSVTLKFAEVSRFTAGARQFNVSIDGARVLTNFDIFAQAGGAFIALDKSFPVAVAGGQITVQFSYGAADAPMVNAIDVEPAAAASSAAVRVNSGGSAYTDTAGNLWQADTAYTGGSTWSVGNAIAGTTAPALYQTCRWGAFTYTFNAPNGNYNVILKFAEVSRFAAGAREFNVSINGSQVLTDFDIFAQARGAFIALDKSFPVTVTAGKIVVQFSYGAADAPMVNAIDIEPTS